MIRARRSPEGTGIRRVPARPWRVAIIGCGAIGRTVARAFARRTIPGTLVAICDIDAARAKSVAALVRPRPRLTTLIGAVRAADIVVECASAAAVAGVVRAARAQGKDVLAVSVAGLLGHPELLRPSSVGRGRLVVPSGALGALDALRAAREAGLTSVALTSAKPPRAYAGAPYVVRRRLNLGSIRTRTVLYRGNALGAARGFPANLNVAATVALAGLGPRRTRVTIVADPALRANVHELAVAGAAGRFTARFENRPFPDNPKTSYLAAVAVIAALRRLLEDVSIGG